MSQGQGEFFTFPVISIMMEKNRPVCLLFGDGTVNKESERNSTMAQNPIVTFETTQGTIEAELYPEIAPNTVNNFLSLVGKGFYDGLIFHRVINGFMIQGGDPNGDGTGGESIWGDAFEDEFSDQLYNFNGALSMANSGADTNGSQFFIVQQQDGSQYTPENMSQYSTDYADNVIAKYQEVGGTPWLDNVHTVFGQVVDGMDVVNYIASVRVDENDKPLEDVVIETITVREASAEDVSALNESE